MGTFCQEEPRFLYLFKRRHVVQAGLRLSLWGGELELLTLLPPFPSAARTTPALLHMNAANASVLAGFST